jgi:hypothetical protein
MPCLTVIMFFASSCGTRITNLSSNAHHELDHVETVSFGVLLEAGIFDNYIRVDGKYFGGSFPKDP